ncbi:ParA family protein [Nakamurella multipartita]|jgi:cellulose biosynthesis protein BcsQ|uniref:Cobyrinic acid ac-diamide synthase n=1 Tax=Nakamurella multipartita (strain ATCC 700099 / DSM 44233 / CIP 104796 / JCM 9543 / NBRC 105858 / Y-104) TaxID=479431 RepID=C8XBU9_NAKMY|nr:ParA family protein [Nakamurella multipartita]ACV79453.1 Cobyrinic acid ac-diamide synthase [Nakamurella multipartita DSM 44233]
MRRVVAIANGKGGVGKTTLTAGLAGQLASGGSRVLVVDTDPQANLARDLGYAAGDGSNLSLAITHGLPLEVIRGVRDRLDVVAGGPALWDVGPAFTARGARGATLPGLKPALAKVAPEKKGADYDVVLVDTPPGEPILQELVFAAADFLIIPTRSDEASLDGLVVVAQRFAAARAVNPKLTLLGVVLFGVRAGSTRMQARVRSALQETLGDAAPVFPTSIRYLESAAVDMRSRGVLPHELTELHRSDTRKRLSRLREGTPADAGDTLLSRDSSAAGLAGDYAALADEVLAAMKARKGGASRRLEVAV